MGLLDKLNPKNLIKKALDFAAPIVSAFNPLAGAVLGFAKGLANGQNPIQSLFSAASGLIPGGGGAGGVLGNLLGKFGGSGGFLDGMGGNSIVSSALNLFSGKKGVTDVLSQVTGSFGKSGGLNPLGMSNLTELAAQRMSQMLLR
ncbi:MAG: hypothetical protein ABW123_28600 [Cystobacter sp.]